MEKSRVYAVAFITQRLPGWRVFVKLKPNLPEKEIARVRELFTGHGFENVAVVAEPADTYIEMSDVIIGMSLPSTTLFSAVKTHPEKPIIHLNVNKELLADGYQNFEGIEYIDTEEKLARVLDSIREGTYQKQAVAIPHFDFADAGELIKHLYAKRIS